MTLLLISFIAGLLTVLAPCVLPLLPVIIGGSVQDTRSRIKPYVITASLGVSIVLFTLLLKFSTAFIDIPQSAWTYFSGTILILFSLTMLFPLIWAKMILKLNFEHASNGWLAKASKKNSFAGDVLMGAALGPVFSSCSPTYFIILATVLPQSFLVGLINLIAYATGLSIILLLIALLGQRFVGKVDRLTDPNGWFKKTIGVIFLLVGLSIMTGIDKKIEAYVLDNAFFSAVDIEQKLLDSVNLK